jgi:hypothetical protein
MDKQRTLRVLLAVALVMLLVGAGMEIYDAPKSLRLIALGALIGLAAAQFIGVNHRGRREV